jgi:formyl-CoA transferase
MVHSPPLRGVRVLEVGNFMATPFCGMQLADLGADVVKVENPDGGDVTRRTGPYEGGESANFIRLNRNKRSLALDLKADAGKRVFKALAARADVVIENLRPGTMRALGLDYPALREANPGLIYVASSGWGQDGPYAARPGLDIMAQAMSGLMSITGEEGGPPLKAGVPLCDLVCALYGALAAVSALYARKNGAPGQFIDVSLYESGVSLAVWEAGQYFGAGTVPHAHGSAHQTTAPYQAFRANDGYFTAGAPTAKLWAALCAALGLDALVDDPRFATNDLRRTNLHELVALIEEKTQVRSCAECIDLLQAAGIPCTPIRNFEEVFNDPHLNERHFFADVPHATAGSVRQVGSPMRMSLTPVEMRSSGPLLGEHSHAVLRDFGFDDPAIAALEASGVVASACVPS